MLGKRRYAALLAAVALIAVPIAGCGGNDDNDSSTEAATTGSTGGGAAGGAGGTVDLSATEFQFTPSDPTVKSGEVTFNLTNDGSTVHSLEIEDVNGEDQELESDVQPGKSGTLKVNLQPGTYEFYCPVDDHKGQGMTGEITVQ